MINKADAEKVKDRIVYSNDVSSKYWKIGWFVFVLIGRRRVIFDLVSFLSHHILGDVTKGSLSW